MTTKILIIDTNTIAYQVAMSIGNGGEAVTQTMDAEFAEKLGDIPAEERRAITETHLLKKEIAYRMRKAVMGLSLLYSPTHIVFAKDSKPYWRSEALKDFYRNNGLVSSDDSVYFYDNYYIPKGENKKKALSVGVLKELDLGAMGFKPPTEEQLEFFPKYKGTRSSFMLNGLTKEDFYQLVPEVYEDLKNRLHGVSIAKPKWEADDIIAHFAKYKKEDAELIIATVDTDLCQLIGFPNVKVYDIRTCSQVTRADYKTIKMNLYVKFVAGDSGDNVSGIPNGNKGCYASGVNGSGTKLVQNTIAQAVEFKGTEEEFNPYEMIERNFENIPAFKRNVELIKLPAPSISEVEQMEFKELVKSMWQRKLPDPQDYVKLADMYGIDEESVKAFLEEQDVNQALLRMRGV